MYLYGKNTRSVTYKQFVDEELILFSNMDNERSIPSLVDGTYGTLRTTFDSLNRGAVFRRKSAVLFWHYVDNVPPPL